ncbi:MAG: [Clostridia bacterium]|nr:[FeFe] hydrogenase H-cluster radical SAM maturase HydE [Clostridia bacterium]
MKDILNKLQHNQKLTYDEFLFLLDNRDEYLANQLQNLAIKTRQKHFGNKVYLRGLIEFSNYCKNNCYYCGIRAGNTNAQRYRLSKEQILDCCAFGYNVGYRTFVLQGGEDLFYSPDDIADIVKSIKQNYPDCAVTLSFGEHPKQTYQKWFDAGADRYLLRHETADEWHYGKLHPQNMSLQNRMECLQSLRDIGYQVGCGIMVGSPFQTNEHIAKDLVFMQDFAPEMVGMGPFIPHKDTPFANQSAGDVKLTLFLLSLVRIILPDVLLPATTALGSLQSDGREHGIIAGANVCMPNLSPQDVRDKYSLYNNKLSSGAESAQEYEKLKQKIENIGYQVVVSRGDHNKFKKGDC